MYKNSVNTSIKTLIGAALKKFQQRREKGSVVTVFTGCHDTNGIVGVLGLRLEKNIYNQWCVVDCWL